MRAPKRADPFYSTPEWKALRNRVIAEQPVCASPYCGKPTRHVDHVESRRRRPDLELSRANTVGYCWGCHSRKTARQDRGFGNAGREERGGCRPDGTPLDPLHPWARG